MSESMEIPHVYASGDEVEPGVYRDLDTGSLIRVYERDTLPHNILIRSEPRLFVREDEEMSRHRIQLVFAEA